MSDLLRNLFRQSIFFVGQFFNQFCFYQRVRWHNEKFDLLDYNKYLYFSDGFQRKDVHSLSGTLLNFTNDQKQASAYIGRGYNSGTWKLLNQAILDNKPFFLLEDGFIRSIFTYAAKVPKELKQGLSFTLDSKGFYFAGGVNTDLESLLLTRNLSDFERQYARNLIDRIVANKLSKYNNQPLTIPKIGKTKKKKVLVIDQSRKDVSLSHGLMRVSFESILNDAINENKDCEVLFKIHPDNIVKNKFDDFKMSIPKGVTVIDYFINPITLIENVEKVYVATSQLGFEALMCNKPVVVYGMPFYAGWGLTIDKMICPRRNRNLTVEELFYITYVVYSKYVDPTTNSICGLDSAIECILRDREKYFKSISNTN